MSRGFFSRFRPKAAAAAAAIPLPPAEVDDEPRYKPIEWSLVRRLLGMLRPHRRLYATAIGFGLVHMLLDMQSPRFIEYIANYVTGFQAGRPARLERACVEGQLPWPRLIALSIISLPPSTCVPNSS